MHISSRIALTCAVIGVTMTVPLGAQKIGKDTRKIGGRDRIYYSYIPDGTDQVPLIVLLHGSGRDGTTLINPWQSLAKQERIALLAPDSLDRQSWSLGADSPAFFNELIDVIRATGRIDPRRIYLFGHSAGGHHSFDLGLLESQYFAAFAVHAGALTHAQDMITSNAERKIPIGMWNGHDDRVVPLDAVWQVRDYLVSKGFSVTLNEMKNHTHDYYGSASQINKEVWNFLKGHRLAADPVFKEYIFRNQ